MTGENDSWPLGVGSDHNQSGRLHSSAREHVRLEPTRVSTATARRQRHVHSGHTASESFPALSSNSRHTLRRSTSPRATKAAEDNEKPRLIIRSVCTKVEDLQSLSPVVWVLRSPATDGTFIQESKSSRISSTRISKHCESLGDRSVELLRVTKLKLNPKHTIRGVQTRRSHPQANSTVHRKRRIAQNIHDGTGASDKTCTEREVGGCGVHRQANKITLILDTKPVISRQLLTGRRQNLNFSTSEARSHDSGRPEEQRRSKASQVPLRSLPVTEKRQRRTDPTHEMKQTPPFRVVQIWSLSQLHPTINKDDAVMPHHLPNSCEQVTKRYLSKISDKVNEAQKLTVSNARHTAAHCDASIVIPSA